ncbi:delta(3,5)-Delta(2,4)-dienoyl-CoA isomerase, mitochondrial isoform X1 [Syngnathus scovelli]|uniref:delta(3,5)-Delta(2,4)-dienoyl-CoA isomerase, mitochondrial isoform X1 n=2 Tax=Syngnathus scovelli TaxID=161590 RepID=UPI00210F5D2A|nr:delta(3,5)-Delta(2,4)-dienoyl-CoA isomerase, mitochondrial isoform X1 [Syngnathus scovelli]XP_049581305.1 delta(3,5)-Delta(2,4)-dienoyl-CoA isomerase, mitochondrial isoform X1 [Syngnathus scovelli]XP_049581306.1 delta(3,5)-Delta(2,4)-dienoyl-CoA isomerase, mitochondrial isoform X1 [Syngnathus scovelli]
MLSFFARSAFTTYRGFGPCSQIVVRTMSTSGGPTAPYTTLAISHPAQTITHVELHRPNKRNAMNKAFWSEMVDCFNEISGDPDCRVVVVSGAGKVFTAGIDLMDMAGDLLQPDGDDTARISWNLRKNITKYQDTFSVIERCPKPVVVAVHGACVGGGVDLITACDIRLCTQDAWFQVKEVDIGLAADVGTLQRLPKVIGSRSLVNDLALTARKMFADEALNSGLVSRVFADKEAMMASALEMAEEMAARSPVAVQGTKVNLIYSRDHSVAEGLDYMATWNMSMLQTADVMKSAQASMEKKSVKSITFSKL